MRYCHSYKIFFTVLIALSISLSVWMLMGGVHEALAVDAGDAMILYGSSTVQTPYFQQWSSSTQSWSNVSTTPSVGGTIKHMVLKSSPVRDEIIAGIQRTDNTLYIQRWNGETQQWSSEWTAAIGSSSIQRFDIAYEYTSGEALVAFSASTTGKFYYRVWDGSVWGASSTYNTSRTSSTVDGIRLESYASSSSNGIAIAWGDRATTPDLSANYWDGTNNIWKTEPNMALSTGLAAIGTSAFLTSWSFDLAFETNSGKLMVAWGNSCSTCNLYYIRRAAGIAGAWDVATSSATIFDEEPVDMQLASDPTSNRIAYANTSPDTGNDAEFAVWSGSAWPTGLDVSSPFSAGSVVGDASNNASNNGSNNNSVQWLVNGSNVRAVVTYDDSSAAGIDWMSYDPATDSWTKENDYTGNPQLSSTNDYLHRNRSNAFNSSEMMWLGVDANSNLFAKKLTFNGSNLTWASTEPNSAVLTTSISSVAPGFAADLSYQRTITPRITASATGTQVTSLTEQSSANYVGGTLTLQRNTGSTTVSQIILSETGGINASTSLSNARIRYETDAAGTCTYNGSETIFGTATAFNSSEQATVTGTMTVGTTTVCLYVEVDIGDIAASSTLDIQITDPSTQVTVSSGIVRPSGTAVAISGSTTVNIIVSIIGSCKQFNRSTACTDGAKVRYAKNSALQSASTTLSGGSFTISPFSGSANDIITVFLDNVAVSSRAALVTKYAGSGDLAGVQLFEHHLVIGSDSNPTVTNADIGQYDNSVSGDADLFFEVDGSYNLAVDTGGAFSDETLLVRSGSTYTPWPGGGSAVTVTSESLYASSSATLNAASSTVSLGQKFENYGTFSAGATSTLVFTGTSASALRCDSCTLNHLSLVHSSLGITTTASSSLTIAGALNISSNDTLAIASGKTLTYTGSGITLSGTISGGDRFIYQSTAAFPSTGTVSSVVRFDAANGGQTIPARTFTSSVEIDNSGAGGGATSWTNRIDVTTSTTATSSDVSIAVDLSGVIHMVYVNSSSSFKVAYRKSTDSGATWSNPVDIATTSMDLIEAPSLTLDSSSNLHVAYTEFNGLSYNLLYRKSTNGGTTWSNPVSITTSTDGDRWSSYPSLSIASSGDLSVAYVSTEYQLSIQNIAYRKSTNGGTSWSNRIDITTSSSASVYSELPSIAVASSGNLHVAYDSTEYEPTRTNIAYRTSLDGGTSWSNRIDVTANTSADSSDLSLSLDSSGNPRVAYHSGEFYGVLPAVYNIAYRTSSDGGTSWSDRIDLTTSITASSSAPSLSVDSSGNSHVAYKGYEYNASYNNISYRKSTDGGTSWPNRIDITTSSNANSQRPKIALDSSGNPYVTYEGYEYDASHSNIAFRKQVSSGGEARTVSMAAGTHTLQGNLTILSSGSGGVELTGSSTNPTVNITGDLSFFGGNGTVNRTGSVTDIHSNASSGSQVISVPSDATLAILGHVGGSGLSAYISGGVAPKLNGASFTNVRIDPTGGGGWEITSLWYLKDPSAGSSTLEWDWGGDTVPDEGIHIFVAFYKGNDRTDPIKSNGGQEQSDNDATTGEMNAASGDLAVAAVYHYQDNAITFSGATSVSQDFYNVARGAFAENTSLSGPVTITASSTAAYVTISGVVIAAGSSTAAANTITAGSGNWTILGNLDVSGASFTAPASLNLGGNYTNMDGTFTHNSGTVTLNGSSTQTLLGILSATSSFNNLTVQNNSGSNPETSPSVIFAATTTAATLTIAHPSAKLRFTASSTYTFTNINWNGQATTTRVALRSSTGTSTKWFLSVATSGSQTVSNVDVRDSDASWGTEINASDGTNLNGGGNTHWRFIPAYPLYQEDYGWFANANALQPGSPLASQNASTTLTSTSTPVRLRINLMASSTQLGVSSSSFKLQFATATSGAWMDVNQNPNGAIDTSWGTNGSTTDNPGWGDRVRNIAIDSSRNLYVAGFTGEDPSKWRLAKYNASGTPDTSWGTNGSTTYIAEINHWDPPSAITIDSSRNIYAAFIASSTGKNWDWHVAKYNASGTPDTSWATNGSTTYGGVGDDAPLGITIDSDRSIYVAGYATSSGLYSGLQYWRIAKYNASGTPDTSWATNGSTTYHSSGIYEEEARDIAIDSDKNIYVAGRTSINDWRMAKYNASGTLDTSWGTNGSTTFYDYSYAFPNSIAIDSSRNIYVGGVRGVWYDFYARIAKYTASGALDTSWATNGSTTSYRIGGNNPQMDIAIDSDRNIYLAGTVSSTIPYWHITKYTASGTPDVSWATNGSTTYGSPTAIESEQAFSIAIDSDRNAYVTGLVEGSGSGSEWRTVKYAGNIDSWEFYDNSSANTNTVFSSNLLGTSNTKETYEEQNPTLANPNAIAAGQRGEWDFSLIPSGAAISNYYFRMARSDGTALDSYVNYPAITVAQPVTAGELSLQNHTSGQSANVMAADEESSTLSNAELLRFSLGMTTENISITTTTISLSNIVGFATADITTAQLWKDIDDNGTVGGGDSQLGSNGTVSISGGAGSVVFSSAWTLSALTSVIFRATLSNIVDGDDLTFSLDPTQVVGQGATSLQTITGGGTTQGVRHARPFKAYRGGPGAQGGSPPTGTTTPGGLPSGGGGTEGPPPTGTTTPGGDEGGGQGGSAQAPLPKLFASVLYSLGGFAGQLQSFVGNVIAGLR